jgi:hypothetical protein
MYVILMFNYRLVYVWGFSYLMMLNAKSDLMNRLFQHIEIKLP